MNIRVAFPLACDLVRGLAPPTNSSFAQEEDVEYGCVYFSSLRVFQILPFVVRRYRAEFLLNRSNVYLQESELKQVVRILFDEIKGINTAVIQNAVFVEEDITQFFSMRKTFVLALPNNAQVYQEQYLSKSLRYDLNREEKIAERLFGGLKYTALVGSSIAHEKYSEAVDMVSNRLSVKKITNNIKHELLSRQPTFISRGGLYCLENNNRMLSCCFFLMHEREWYFISTGFDSSVETNVSLGKLVLLSFIRYAIENCVRYIHLGGGDYGYKNRFGAIEVALKTVHYGRTGLGMELGLDYYRKIQGQEERVRATGQFLNSKASVLNLEGLWGGTLESTLGSEFERACGVDFNSIVGSSSTGMSMHGTRYQPASREAFHDLMSYVEFDDRDVFVDIGCGKGKAIYYALCLGYNKCLGIEYSKILSEIASKNFVALNVAHRVQVLNMDAGDLDPCLISLGSVIYLYNPFSGAVLSKFLRVLKSSIERQPREVTVAYLNCVHHEVFVELDFKIIRHMRSGVDGWRYNDSCIYKVIPLLRNSA